MWSFLLLLFLFFWTNDELPRFKRGSRSFSVLAVGIISFVTMFTYIHQDRVVHGTKPVVCPQQFDLGMWLGVDLINAVRVVLIAVPICCITSRGHLLRSSTPHAVERAFG